MWGEASRGCTNLLAKTKLLVTPMNPKKGALAVQRRSVREEREFTGVKRLVSSLYGGGGEGGGEEGGGATF